MSTPHILAVASGLFYSLPGLSKAQKVFWASLIRVIYGDTATESEIQYHEAKGAVGREQQVALLDALSIDQLISVTALFELLGRKTEPAKESNEVARLQLLKTLHDRLTALNAGGLDGRIQEFERALTVTGRKYLLRIPGSIWPLLLDFAMRFLLLMGVSRDPVALNGMIIFQIFFVPPVVLLVAHLVGRSDRRYHEQLFLAEGGVKQFRIEYSLTAMQYTVLAFLFANGVYITSILYDQIFILPVITGLLVYYYIYIRFYCVGRITFSAFRQSVAESKRERIEYDADSNDAAIVDLETRLTSTTSRLEAYVLESALFGALSFSGFLQIVSDNQVSFETLEAFSNLLAHASEGVIMGDMDQYFSSIQQLSSKENLFCLVSLETLLCSIFFLAVIASRLQFSNVSDRALAALNRAKAYNQKEEALIEAEVRDPNRMRVITQRVNAYIHEGESIMEEVRPVTSFMQYFRNAGLLVFLLILITSSFFITAGLALGFFLMSLVSWVYFNRKHLQTDVNYILLELRYHFMRRGALLFGGMIALMALAVFTRVQWGIEAADGLFMIGFAGLCLSLVTWLIFIPHVDPRFGSIESSDVKTWSDGRWNIVKSVAGCFIPAYLISQLMKANSIIGSDEVLLISMNLLAAITYFMAFYLSRPRWVGIFPAIALSNGIIGVLFKTLHLAGADEMILIGLVSVLVAVPLMVIFRRRFHTLFLRIYFVILLAISLSATGWYWRTFLMYEYRTWNVRRIEGMFNSAHWVGAYPLEVSKEEWRKLIAETDWYFDSYGDTTGSSRVQDALMFSLASIAESALASDTISREHIELGLDAARRHNRIAIALKDTRDPTTSEAMLYEPRLFLRLGDDLTAQVKLETIKPLLAPDVNGEVKSLEQALGRKRDDRLVTD